MAIGRICIVSRPIFFGFYTSARQARLRVYCFCGTHTGMDVYAFFDYRR